VSAARVRVPATSANLGPAFDCAGLALSRHDVLEFAVLPSGLEVSVSGVGGGELPTDESLRVVRAFAPILAGNGGGAIVNVHSVLSWVGGSGAYGASKAAIWSITNSLRTELAPQNTQVVGVHVGFIDTEMVADIALPKTAPDDVAARIVDALEAGAVEVLADDITAEVKAALSGPVEALTFALAH